MISLIDFIVPSTGNFLVDIIKWLIDISSSIALGIVLFTVILKLITLPFDFISRASMRKNSLKMEQMRPELEKLQKQYENDKNLYNQKMAALYKKNGYSMFGACLPTILTLVIFIVAINAYTSFSNYQDRKYFYEMSIAYNGAVYAGFEIDESENKYITKTENGEVIFKDNELLLLAEENEYGVVSAENESGSFNILVKKGVRTTTVSGSEGDEVINQLYYSVKTQNGYVEYIRLYSLSEDGNTPVFANAEYEIFGDNLSGGENATAVKNLATPQNNYLKNGKGEYFDEAENATPLSFVEDVCQTVAANKFRDENVRFLWVKNIWVTDSPLAHPVEGNYDSKDQAFKNSVNKQGYESLIAKLSDEQTQANGYFILAILTAGISFLTQFVMSKAQKAQMELQTVDGQGAKTQKIMMWMMPIMMAVFSFMYTAAFSIYMILSSVISIITTLSINAIIDRKFKKKTATAEGGDVLRGRVYVPKEEEKEKKKEKNSKKKKEEQPGDFISGENSKKHIRGRLK